jgi:hypothetical protein
LQTGKKYIQTVTKKDYKDFSRTFSVPNNPAYKELKYDVNLLESAAITQPISEPLPKDSITVQKDTAILHVTPAQTAQYQEPENECLNKLYKHKNLSFGLTGSIPLSYGLKGEYDYKNFGIAVAGIHFPNIGELDETKPGDEFKSDNYSELLLFAITYHLPIDCQVFPFIGVYTGLQFRNWKKDIGTPGPRDVQSGSYTARHYGITAGLKFFVIPNLYLEGSLGFGEYSVHGQPSSGIIRWDLQVLGWFSICYNFNVDRW